MRAAITIGAYSIATFFLGIGLGTLKTANFGGASTSQVVLPIALGSTLIILTTPGVKKILDSITNNREKEQWNL